MNIVLTTRCNKNCSFCFARKSRKETPLEDMTLPDFQGLLDLIDSGINSIKLLGGEPTLHPEFSEILALLNQKQVSVTLISNLLYSHSEIRNCILTAIKNKTIVGCLANASELEDSEKLNIFKTNYSVFVDKLSANVTLGITLSRSKTTEEELSYLDFLTNAIPNIHQFRLSLDFLDGNQNDDFFINNKNYGKKILAIINKCLDLRIPMSWDCKIYPCLFEDKDFQKYVIGFVKNIHWDCLADSIPLDIFPDMSYIHCYPARALSGQNILKFSRLSDALREIAFLKLTLQSQEKQSLPMICQKCIYYKNIQCDSLCLGCQELSESFLKN